MNDDDTRYEHFSFPSWCLPALSWSVSRLCCSKAGVACILFFIKRKSYITQSLFHHQLIRSSRVCYCTDQYCLMYGIRYHRSWSNAQKIVQKILQPGHFAINFYLCFIVAKGSCLPLEITILNTIIISDGYFLDSTSTTTVASGCYLVLYYLVVLLPGSNTVVTCKSCCLPGSTVVYSKLLQWQLLLRVHTTIIVNRVIESYKYRQVPGTSTLPVVLVAQHSSSTGTTRQQLL